MNDEKHDQGPRGEVVLEVKNLHYHCCGIPPIIDPSKGLVCYFQNCYGEQNLLFWDRNTRNVQLWMGDVGWEEPLEVVEFRERVLVRFSRSRENREKEFKMNLQFKDDARTGKANDPELNKLLRQLREQVRKTWGKPLLTDEQVEYVLHCPTIQAEEYSLAKEFYLMCRQHFPANPPSPGKGE